MGEIEPQLTSSYLGRVDRLRPGLVLRLGGGGRGGARQGDVLRALGTLAAVFGDLADGGEGMVGALGALRHLVAVRRGGGPRSRAAVAHLHVAVGRSGGRVGRGGRLAGPHLHVARVTRRHVYVLVSVATRLDEADGGRGPRNYYLKTIRVR